MTTRISEIGRIYPLDEQHLERVMQNMSREVACRLADELWKGEKISVCLVVRTVRERTPVDEMHRPREDRGRQFLHELCVQDLGDVMQSLTRLHLAAKADLPPLGDELAAPVKVKQWARDVQAVLGAIMPLVVQAIQEKRMQRKPLTAEEQLVADVMREHGEF